MYGLNSALLLCTVAEHTDKAVICLGGDGIWNSGHDNGGEEKDIKLILVIGTSGAGDLV